MGVALRPHAKSNKCAEIARRQIAAGAVGVCVQKVSEAMALAEAGIDDILICNELVGERKIAALVELSGRIRVAACVDDLGNVAAIERAAAGRRNDRVADGRCRRRPGPLRRAAARGRCSSRRRSSPRRTCVSPACRPTTGRAARPRSVDERRAAAAVGGRAGRGRARCAGRRRHRLPRRHRRRHRHLPATKARAASTPRSSPAPTCSWTPTTTATVGATGPAAREAPPFRQSLYVLATVMSRVDAEPADRRRGPEGAGGGQRHAAGRRPARGGLRAGQRRARQPAGGGAGRRPDVRRRRSVTSSSSIPGHCDPTVNLYDWLVAVRAGRVEAVWPVTARGCLS